MKSKFPGYYRVHRDDLLARFDDCVFIFDACSLLDIYRMKKEVTEDVFKVIEKLKKQIKVPYHVAEEYFSNINTVLIEQLNNIKKTRSDFNMFVQSLEMKRSQPYISEIASSLLNKLKKRVEIDFKEQEDFIKDQLIHGDFQNRLSELLEGNVLEPFSEQEIAEIEKEGDNRYENKIPPGYKDATKSSNRYGDLINWKEILRFARESKKCVIIVSSDIKEDWVIREQGKTICLKYELINEFYRTVEDKSQLIHFLSLDRFLEFAREKDNQMISEKTVKEVKDYIVLPKINEKWQNWILEYEKANVDFGEYYKKVKDSLEALEKTQYKTYYTTLKDRQDQKKTPSDIDPQSDTKADKPIIKEDKDIIKDTDTSDDKKKSGEDDNS